MNNIEENNLSIFDWMDFLQINSFKKGQINFNQSIALNQAIEELKQDSQRVRSIYDNQISLKNLENNISKFLNKKLVK
jgi:hypothetical protein